MIARRHFVLAGLLASLLATAPAAASDWPQLLGPTRDGVAPGEPVRPWSASGPKVLWSFDVGAGLAGPAVAGDSVLVFHRIGNREVLTSLERGTGKERWQSAYATSYRDDFGFDEGPRAVPVVSEGRVFTLGAQGRLTCFELASGMQLWQRDTRADFAVRKGFFGVATSPIVVRDRVLVNVGGQGAGIVAFDRATGRTVWQKTDDEQSYSSPTLAQVGGRRAVLFFTREGLLAVEPASGEVMMRFAHKTRIRSSVNAATPLVVGTRVFLSAEYGAGAVLLELGAAGSEPAVIWRGARSMNNHYATAVHRDGVLYGFHGRQESRAALRAVDFATGEVRWSEDRFGAGAVLLSGDRLVVLREDGELLLVAAEPGAFRVLARAQVLDSVTRAYPALADRVLYARDPRRLVAVDLSGG